MLSIIIPFGTSDERAYIAQRVRQKALEFRGDENYEFIFVEGFCSGKDENLGEFIIKQGHKFYKDSSQKNFFSQGQCRNLGALKASSKVLLFLDVDCFIDEKSLAKIRQLAQIRQIEQKQNEFFLLPCFYLNEKAGTFLQSKNPDEFTALIQNDFFSGAKNYVKNFALFSSMIVMNRLAYLVLGGMSEEFSGHGYEDFEFFLRLLDKTCKFELLPKNLSYDSRNWDFNEFEGFRALFSLFGYEGAFLGLYALHFHHQNPNQNDYLSYKEQNHALFFEQILLFERGQIKHLRPLQDENYEFEKRKISLDFIAYQIYKNSLKSGVKILPNALKIKLSQSKTYRLFRKFKASPKEFFKDSKIFRRNGR